MRALLLVGLAGCAGCTLLFGDPRADGAAEVADLALLDGAQAGSDSDLPHLWSTMDSNTLESLSAVWGCSKSEVNVVGSNGTILRSTSPGVWARQLPTARDLTGVGGLSCAKLYAVGAGGTVLATDKKGNWATQPSGTMVDLAAAFGTATAIVAVGTGAIERSTGANWSPAMGAGSAGLLAVWGAGTSFFAAGKNGALLHSTDSGNQWTAGASGTAITLRGGWSSAGDSHIYLVGDAGTILHSTDGGGTFVVSAAPSAVTLHAVWGSGPDDVYVVGDGGLILHSTDAGASWKEEGGASGTLLGIWGSSATDVYAVGVMGEIIHRP